MNELRQGVYESCGGIPISLLLDRYVSVEFPLLQIFFGVNRIFGANGVHNVVRGICEKIIEVADLIALLDLMDLRYPAFRSPISLKPIRKEDSMHQRNKPMSQQDSMGQVKKPMSQQDPMGQVNKPMSQQDAMGQVNKPMSQQDSMGQVNKPMSQQDSMGQVNKPMSQQDPMGQVNNPMSQQDSMGK
ncbi:hypothetical protein K1719_047427, partial [Acacia pycnantha]